MQFTRELHDSVRHVTIRGMSDVVIYDVKISYPDDDDKKDEKLTNCAMTLEGFKRRFNVTIT